MSDETPRHDEKSDRSDERPYTIWTFLKGVLLQLAIFFTLYTLSIGPLYWRWYAAKFLSGEPTLLGAFYEPLYRFAGWCEPFGEFLNWYVGLWVG